MQGSKATSNRVSPLVGIVDGKIVKLRAYCVRKNCIRRKMTAEAKLVKRGRAGDVLGITSHPTVHRSKTAPYVKGWLHCFRDPGLFLPQLVPNCLLSESDFVDPKLIPIRDSNDKQWDFFYFTIGGRKANLKGWDVFLESLPIICGQFNLKGVVINYFREEIEFANKSIKKTWKSFRKSGNLDYYHKRLNAKEVANIMANSRFGFFPNTRDCSPLLLVESLIRNIPVLVNEDIMGGWKYVNEKTGSLFNSQTLTNSINDIRNSVYSPRDYFLENYGFKKAAEKLAKFGAEHFKSFNGCQFACFEKMAPLLQKLKS